MRNDIDPETIVGGSIVSETVEHNGIETVTKTRKIRLNGEMAAELYELLVEAEVV